MVVEPGDRIFFDMEVFDSAARLLYSTNENATRRLEASRTELGEPFTLPDSFEPQGAYIWDLRPFRLGNDSSMLLAEEVLGKPVGSVARPTFVGRLEGYAEEVVLDRSRGPFPLRMTISPSLLDAYKESEEDDRVIFEGALPARILNRTPGAATIEFAFEDGEVVNLTGTSIRATVRLHEDGGFFSIHLDAQTGDRFSLYKDCAYARYVLRAGSYLVENVGDDQISFKRSGTIYPQMIGKELTILARITEIIRPDGSGGET